MEPDAGAADRRFQGFLAQDRLAAVANHVK
jgi:hypothetical protein